MWLHRARSFTAIHTNRPFHVLRIVLGGFLLLAALLKGHGLALDPFAEGSVLASPPSVCDNRTRNCTRTVAPQWVGGASSLGGGCGLVLCPRQREPVSGSPWRAV